MYKSCYLTWLLLSSALTFAGEAPQVKITSFLMTGSQTRIAELCGKLTSPSVDPNASIRITVDPKTDHPGTYRVFIGKEASFCTLLLTYTRTAEASLVSTDAQPNAPFAAADVAGASKRE